MAKHVTLADIAAHTGLAPSTVSRALHNSSRVTAATRRHVQAVAKELHYQPNVLAQSIRNQRTNTVGVVISNILNPYFTEVLRGISDELLRANTHMILFNTDEQPEKETRILQSLTGQMVDGLIIVSTGGIANYDALTQAAPTVFVDRVPNAASIARYDAVLTDNVPAATSLTTRLLDAGATRLGFIGSAVAFSAAERETGYRTALKNHGLSVKRNLIRHTNYTPETTARIVNELRQTEHVDGLVIADSVILGQVLKTLTASTHQAAPLQLGTFDYLAWFDYLNVDLIAAQQSTYQLGHVAVTTLFDRIAHPEAPVSTTRFPVTFHEHHPNH
ncbi:LacI family DNA-binding transcriptional regulator [Furfurilactobacillus entadae]|uniref:LacI family DNA-binding transcriptional regulator n=1 Tax=Furfurilactobacillus entadae TaxID=2922307 RepID=UPI0035F019B3